MTSLLLMIYQVDYSRARSLLQEVGCLYCNCERFSFTSIHYSDVIMSTMASQFTGVSFVYSTVCSGTDQGKHQSALVAFVRGIHRSPTQRASNAENVSI